MLTELDYETTADHRENAERFALVNDYGRVKAWTLDDIRAAIQQEHYIMDDTLISDTTVYMVKDRELVPVTFEKVGSDYDREGDWLYWDYAIVAKDESRSWERATLETFTVRIDGRV